MILERHFCEIFRREGIAINGLELNEDLGIGLSFVKLAAAQTGTKVIIGDLKLTAEAEDLIDTNTKNVIFSRCDVTKRADLENLITVSVKEFGDVPDIYIAGAGVFEPVRRKLGPLRYCFDANEAWLTFTMSSWHTELVQFLG